MMTSCWPTALLSAILKVHAAPVGTPWMWTLAFEHHEDRTPPLGYEPTREAAMAAFAKSWRGPSQMHRHPSAGSDGLERATFGVTGRTKCNGINDSCKFFCGRNRLKRGEKLQLPNQPTP
jgi:hypothetical protein